MKRAFTLVELMVVIGILGILIGVLLGAIGGSTESANAAKCQANMRNLAMAVQATAMERKKVDNHYYPYAGSFKQYSGGSKNGKRTQKLTLGWIGSTGTSYPSPYESSQEDFEKTIEKGQLWSSMNHARECYVCPGHVRQAKKMKQNRPLWSYAMNAYFGWAGDGKPRAREYFGVCYESLSRTDRRLLFAELPYAVIDEGAVSQNGELSGTASDPVLQYKGCTGEGKEAIGFNHKNGKLLTGHICFADGHVEKLIAPKSGDVVELTSWLCNPTDDNGDFDVVFDGGQYKKSE